MREANGLPTPLGQPEAQIDVIQFDREVRRIEAADRLELSAFDSQTSPGHRRDFVKYAMAREPAG